MKVKLFNKIFYSALKLPFLLTLFLVSVKAYPSCFPDTLHIKPVTITGERPNRLRTGAITSTIDSTALIKALTANLSDLILQNTPIFIKEYGRGAMATASFRGTAPSHTQVLWNGINISSPMLGMVDFSTIPVYFIDNVTLLHGSSSLSENSGALGGIIKLQNTPDFMNRFSGRALTGIGSYGTRDEMIRLNFGNQKIQSQTRGFYNYSDNDFSFINKLNANIDPLTGKYNYPLYKNLNAYYRNYGLLQEIYYRPNEKNLLSFRYWYQQINRGLPKLLTYEGEFDTNINRQEENAHRVSLEWKNIGRHGTLSLSSGLNVEFLNYWFGKPDQYVFNSLSRTLSLYNKIVYDYRFKNGFSISTGMDATIHDVISTNFPFNSEPYGYSRTRYDNDAFLNLSKCLGEKVFLNLLARQNLIDGQFTPLIPSFGLEYRGFSRFLIKTNIARNFHEPTLNDLYIIPGGNPKLKAEEGITADLGTSYSGSIGNSSFKMSVNGYMSRISNWIIWIPKPFWTPFNLKTVDASGIEIKTDLKGQISNLKYQLDCNYAFSRSVNKDDSLIWADDSYGKQLPYIPLHSANASFNLSENGYHINWTWTYYSKRYTTTTEDHLDVIYPYIMNNLTVGKGIKLKKTMIDLELKILNVFDEQYRSVLQNPMPGRNYSLLLRYDF